MKWFMILETRDAFGKSGTVEIDVVPIVGPLLSRLASLTGEGDEGLSSRIYEAFGSIQQSQDGVFRSLYPRGSKGPKPLPRVVILGWDDTFYPLPPRQDKDMFEPRRQYPKIRMIKLIRQWMGFDLATAKNMLDAVERTPIELSLTYDTSRLGPALTREGLIDELNAIHARYEVR